MTKYKESAKFIFAVFSIIVIAIVSFLFFAPVINAF